MLIRLTASLLSLATLSAAWVSPVRVGPVTRVPAAGQRSPRAWALASAVADELGEGVQYGDTAGAALIFEDVRIRRGAAELVTGVNWKVMPGERWGVVGPNGAGKSTLLGALLGIHPIADGRVRVREGSRVGYMEQRAVSGSGALTVREVAMSRMDGYADAKAALDAATARIEGGDFEEDAMNQFAEAQDAVGLRVSFLAARTTKCD